ncbi:Hypothetical protein GL50581_1577 [Giardia duodenalis ATCC 50581]|uniref:Uncharacterized protein n=1 Tax=Giardia intestinalis (strain ATCC 50581 / GS clone H7) TaxID=598745 RepID=C6LS41_GIAIB|nr:Hypothetical protein GL50581_1577 [Giardia intestinalis ATCC 50581]
MSDSSHQVLCPECRERYDVSSLASHLCFGHGLCPFCLPDKSITEELYPELACTKREVVSRLVQTYRKISSDLLAPWGTEFPLEACSSTYSTYVASFSLLHKFPYGLPPPISMLVHLIIEHPSVGYRLSCSLDGAKCPISVYARLSRSTLVSLTDIQLCPDCFLFYTNKANHCNQCKGYYRHHFRHYLHYRSSLVDDTVYSKPPVHASVEGILAHYFCLERLKDNLDCSRRYMGLCTPSNSNIADSVKDNLQRYFACCPTFESLSHPGKTYKIESLELQGSHAFGRATVYSDIDFHILILKADDTHPTALDCEDVRDCLSALIMHLQAPSSRKWLDQLSADKPIKYCRGNVGFIELSLSGATQSVSLVFGDQNHIALGRRRVAVMRSFYLDKLSVYERAEAFLKQWLFMSRTTEGSTAMGLTKFASLTILQRVCLFTDVGSLLRRFFCYDPDGNYEAMLDPPPTSSQASGELLSLYHCNYDTNNTDGVTHLSGVTPNVELADPAKFQQLVIDHCADSQSRGDIVSAIRRIANSPEDVSFIWAFILVHEVLRYHRDFYLEAIEYKLSSNQEVPTRNVLYKLQDLLSISMGQESLAVTGTRTCVSTHVTRTMTLACIFRTLLTIETSMLFLRYFLPTPPHCSIADREILQSLRNKLDESDSEEGIAL